MADKKQFNVAIIGLGFGAEFIPIYQRHPQANMYAICQRNREKLNAGRRRVQDRQALHALRGRAGRSRTSISSTSTRRSPTTPRRSIAALKAGKHVMCTVPMATTVEECRQIVELVAEDRPEIHDGGDGRLRPRVSVRARSCIDKGELGKIQFLQASHQQDMDGWPNYWPGLPPMHYATHCVGPCLALTRGRGRVRLLLRLRHASARS